MESLKSLKKISLFLCLLGLISFSYSCSKEESEPAEKKGKVEDAVGIYKGVLEVGSQDYYDAILEVSQVGDQKLSVKAKVGQPYSNITTKIFTVEVGDYFNVDPIDIASLSISPEGLFHYDGLSKSISVITSKQLELEISYSFEGTKQ
ncbi:hypothetical protein ACFRAE_08335 [Sphingobacterium sp. HJSM2_6]|uniref:hypothetical protein n=1 Tax=Sphingobacterium sp. HJSM2_6 TaxID=3366264 RepID=UPI003BD1258B